MDTKKAPTIAEALKDIRKRLRLSQKEIAKRLETTQVHISRLESGGRASEALRYKILKLFEDEKADVPRYDFEKSCFHKVYKHWEIAYFSYPRKLSGDKIFYYAKNSWGKAHLLHCDAAGMGAPASRDTDYLFLLSGLILNMLKDHARPDSIYTFLNKVIGQNKKMWQDSPSSFFITAYEKSDRLELICAGMPRPYVLRSKGNKLEVFNGSSWPPVGNKKKEERFEVDILTLEKKDTLITFSDGFLQNFNKFSDEKLDVQIPSLAKFKKENIYGLLLKLLKNFEDKLLCRELNDDVSCLMIRNKG